MKIAALQMVSSADVPANVAQAADLIAQAAAAGAELIVLPEYWCQLGLRDNDKLSIAEADGHGPLQEFLQTQASRHGVYLVGGTLPIQTSASDKVFNSSLVFNPKGERIARYDKIHLFAFHKGREAYNEGKLLQAGAAPVAFDLPSSDGHTWRIGLSVCYDLRFPELYRQLAADLYLVPSAFTYTTGQVHWEVLLRARAIENLAFVAAAAQGGTHSNGRQTWGHAMVIEPWGSILAQQASDAGVVLADCDYASLQAQRLQLPALRHRVL